MKLKADDKGRLTCAELFTPNAAFEAKRQADGSVRIVELASKDAPMVRPIQTREGFVLLPRKLDRKTVAAAVRADRDAR